MNVSKFALAFALAAAPVSVMAQDATTPAPAVTAPAPAPDAMAPAAPDAMAPADNMAPAATDATAPAAMPARSASSILATGYTTTDKDNLSTEIVGKPVYSGPANDAEQIGDINNLVIGEDGKVAAVIIGVGGFLGMAEKNVAVNYSELQMVVAEDKSERYVLATTKEALETAPDFTTTDNAATDGAVTAPATDAMAPATDAATPAK
ncbi:PRC-barrel domain-containing protein [Devosia sp.]|uniref:PRC-barrel domain-containing protein n=1 Tax=Devosia sp. TaxID=1871048 RepID=UPI0032674308